MTTEEKNEQIALMIGWRKGNIDGEYWSTKIEGHYSWVRELQFDNDWNHIMEAINWMNDSEYWEEYDLSNLATLLVSADKPAVFEEIYQFSQLIKKKNEGNTHLH
jgi:hypothetical protein